MTSDTVTSFDELAAARRQRDEVEGRLLQAEARVNHLNTLLTDTERERGRHRDALAAKEAEFAAVVAQRNGSAFRAAVHADTLMKVLILAGNSSDTATSEKIRAAIRAGRDAVTGPRPGAPARPSSPPTPDATATVTVTPMSFHIGRGDGTEQKCPCPLMPCGLVLDIDANPSCPHHGRWAADNPMRQFHPHDHCPAAGA